MWFQGGCLANVFVALPGSAAAFARIAACCGAAALPCHGLGTAAGAAGDHGCTTRDVMGKSLGFLWGFPMLNRGIPGIYRGFLG